MRAIVSSLTIVPLINQHRVLTLEKLNAGFLGTPNDGHWQRALEALAHWPSLVGSSLVAIPSVITGTCSCACLLYDNLSMTIEVEKNDE